MKKSLIGILVVGIGVAVAVGAKQNPIRVEAGNLAIQPNLPEMVKIPAGAFLMGQEGGTEYEKPVHEVVLPDYWIAAREVTNSEYRRFCDATGTPFPPAPLFDESGGYFTGKPDFPVVEVSWSDAARYCLWLSKRTGRTYRLPTEAEWEKAARGGLQGKMYPWGDEADTTRARCNLKALDGGPVKVGSYPPNGYGLYDMAGNVNEMCQDWFDEYYYRRSPKDDPEGPDGLRNYLTLLNPPERSRSKGRCHIVRGGSYRAPINWQTVGPDGRLETPIQCGAREYLYQAPYTHFDLGFRVASRQG